MQLHSALCLLLACAVSIGHSAVILDNGMPILWAQTVGQPNELPIQNDMLRPNPFNYLNRMSLYRLLIAATDLHMGSMGTGSNESPIWGLPLQLAWMLTSGRLVDPTGATSCGMETGDTMCISTESWWGCENYFVSVLPFLSATKSGFMGNGVQAKMQVPDGMAHYCSTYDECAALYPDAMTKWDAFFQGLKDAADSPLPDNQKKDGLLGLFWQAQMASTYASSACEAKKSHYSTVEVTFLNHWLALAEYVSAAHFQSNLEKSSSMITPLPGRILKEGDVAPNVEGLSQEENKMLETISWMDSLNNHVAEGLVATWKSAMCSTATREQGRKLLEQVLHTDVYNAFTLMTIITTLALLC